MRSNRGRRHGLAADAVKAVAAGNEIAQKLLFLPIGAESDARLFAGDVVQSNVVSRIDRRRTDSRAAVHEIFGDLGLAVDHHGLAGHFLE